MPSLCSKDFREFATVETPTETSDGAGGYTTAWLKKCDLWCMVDEAGGNESLVASRLQTSTSMVFTTHYRSDITTKERIVFEGIVYNIRRVENIERKDRFIAIYSDGGVAS